MLQPRNEIELLLENKLQRLASGESVLLNVAEAQLYGINIADILSGEDCEIDEWEELRCN